MPKLDKTPASDTITAASATAPADASGPAAVVKSDAVLVTVDAPAVGGLAEAAAALGAPLVPLPVGGSGVGADRLAQRAEGVETVALDPRTADPRGPTAAERYGTGFSYGAPRAAAIETTRLSPARTVIDPDEVPGTRLLETLTQVRHDGRDYAPGEDIELDFRSYEQLVAIGAVPPIDWSTGRPIEVSRVRVPRV